jgi:hypothetical protein
MLQLILWRDFFFEKIGVIYFIVLGGNYKLPPKTIFWITPRKHKVS